MHHPIRNSIKLTTLTSKVKKSMAGLQHKPDKKGLARWAADCAEHVLPYFEKERPNDDRPREAIEACREWADTGVFSMSHVRGTSLAAHAAAREAKDEAACAAARAAGQALATAHVPDHAIAAAAYALKAAAMNSNDIDDSISKEHEWQLKDLLSLER